MYIPNLCETKDKDIKTTVYSVFYYVLNRCIKSIAAFLLLFIDNFDNAITNESNSG